MSTLRKTMIALFAVASIGMLAPDAALAFGHGGGGHGGGFGGHGGFGGGHGWGGHGGFGGFHGGRFYRGWGVGPGFYFGPGYYDDYPYYYGYEGYGGCYLVRQRVHTRHGWRYRNVEVCR